MMHYFIQILIFQFCFLLLYDLFLKKETFFNINRVYLILTSILSIALPYLKFDSLSSVIPKEYIVQLPAILIGEQLPQKVASINTYTQHISENGFVWSWTYLLYLGVVISSFLFLLKAFKLFRLYLKNPKLKINKITIIKLPKSQEAFSFFNWVFIGENVRSQDEKIILDHELVHIRQFHSLDLIWFELLRILFWFNPLLYIYQKRVTSLHEYIADSESIKVKSEQDYYQELLNQIFKTSDFSFVNPFFKQSLIKKRIAMLSKSKSSHLNLLKYTALLPVVIGMLIYTSCNKEVMDDQLIVNKELQQYSYSLAKDGSMDAETKKAHKLYEDFLLNNSDYVSWAQTDLKTNEIYYSIHHQSEPVPDGYSKLEVSFPNGNSYISYMNLPNSKTPNSSNSQISNSVNPISDEVPYALIDVAPSFQGCDPSLSGKDKKRCTSDRIASFVNKNFNTNLGSEHGLEGRQRINVIFKIGADGVVRDVRARAPHIALEEEAIRVISSMPRFMPGLQNGEPAVVPYSLPIVFQVRD